MMVSVPVLVNELAELPAELPRPLELDRDVTGPPDPLEDPAVSWVVVVPTTLPVMLSVSPVPVELAVEVVVLADAPALDGVLEEPVAVVEVLLDVPDPVALPTGRPEEASSPLDPCWVVSLEEPVAPLLLARVPLVADRAPLSPCELLSRDELPSPPSPELPDPLDAVDAPPRELPRLHAIAPLMRGPVLGVARTRSDAVHEPVSPGASPQTQSPYLVPSSAQT